LRIKLFLEMSVITLFTSQGTSIVYRYQICIIQLLDWCGRLWGLLMIKKIRSFLFKEAEEEIANELNGNKKDQEQKGVQEELFVQSMFEEKEDNYTKDIETRKFIQIKVSLAGNWNNEELDYALNNINCIPDGQVIDININ